MICLSIFAFLAAVQVAHSVVVPCGYQNASCICPVGEAECEFTFRVESRQASASYEIQPDGTLSDTGVPYNLSSTNGYVPRFVAANRPCLFNFSVVNDQDFIDGGCSVPLTLDGVSGGTNLITINGRMPGPTLVVDHEAIVRVTVKNRLRGDATSIHWHGMYQRHTPWMDGVGGITQPSIAAGTNFDYIFDAIPRGTHWYHSHVGEQRIEGLLGALVVRDELDSTEVVPEDSNAVIVDEPGEYTFNIIDWQLLSGDELQALRNLLGMSPFMPALQVVSGGMTPIERGRIFDGSDLGPIPFHSGLINGRGRFQDTRTPLTVFRVAPNKYYRFRVVGAQDQHAFSISVDGHNLRAIATDGKGFQHKDVDYINVETGERYDFLLYTNATPGNYWLRADTLQANAEGEQSARAIISYDGAASLDWRNGYSNVPNMPHICTPEDQCQVLNCPFLIYPPSQSRSCVSLADLRPRPPRDPVERPSYPPPSDCGECMYFINFAFDFGVSLNATNFQFPERPYQTYCGEYDRDNSPDSSANTCEKNCTDGGCTCIHVIPMASNSTFIDDKNSDSLLPIYMVFSTLGSSSSHPIHMHGHAYHVLHIGYGTYNDSTGKLIEDTQDLVCDDDPCTDPQWRNGSPPQGVLDKISDGRVNTLAIQKDTVVVPAGGYVVVAIRADNPGYWFLHCHIEGHTSGGMIATLQEYSSDQHWLPPDGINEQGNFEWTIQQYMAHIAAQETCADDVPTTPVVISATTSAAEITISRAGFGVALAILILLAIVCVVFAVLLLVVCLKAKKNPVHHEKIGMTTTN